MPFPEECNDRASWHTQQDVTRLPQGLNYVASGRIPVENQSLVDHFVRETDRLTTLFE